LLQLQQLVYVDYEHSLYLPNILQYLWHNKYLHQLKSILRYTMGVFQLTSKISPTHFLLLSFLIHAHLLVAEY